MASTEPKKPQAEPFDIKSQQKIFAKLHHLSNFTTHLFASKLPSFIKDLHDGRPFAEQIQ